MNYFAAQTGIYKPNNTSKPCLPNIAYTVNL